MSKILVLIAMILISSIPRMIGAQEVSFRIPVNLTNGSDGRGDDSLTFGIDFRATICEDTALGEFSCPFPGECGQLPLCMLFDPPVGTVCEISDYPCTLDIRPYRNRTQVDTFVIYFSNQPEFAPNVFHRPANVSQYFDSAVLTDHLHFYAGVDLGLSTNMLAVDSLLIPPNHPFSAVVIRTVGPKLVTAVREVEKGISSVSMLHQNFPNPFNPSTLISYSVSRTSEITPIIFDVPGREVERLIDTRQQPGLYTVRWDAADRAAGVYLYHLQTERSTHTGKMILIR